MSNGKDYDIFSGPKLIESIRSGGYEDTSYAVAELVDNAIDAKSKHVSIICQERLHHSTNRHHLEKIAVLDNGTGMNSEELRNSLLFGDGTRGKEFDIGKFGMGLPNASLSQCKRVEVYSWQHFSTPLYSYLDYDEIKAGNRSIPIPEPKDIPEVFSNTIKNIPQESGTLVVWSKLDRCSWTTSKALIRNSQFIIGRIYRKFLHAKKLVINVITMRVDDEGRPAGLESENMLPNDPMYLMAPTTTPGKWGKTPMFKPDTKPEDKFGVKVDGETHVITVRYSLEKDELRSPEHVQGDQGGTSHGLHAKKNMGVSIIRAGREVTMDTNLLLSSEPRDRWWGVEIDIPSSLDLVVGLTNNKQHVDTISAIMQSVGKFEEDDSDEREMMDEFSEYDKTKLELIRIITEIKSRIRSMRKRIRATRSDTRKTPPGQKTPLEKKIEKGLSEEKEEGKKGQTDIDRENMKDEERIALISDALVDEGYEQKTANKTAKEWVDDDKKIVFMEGELDGSNFFTVNDIGGILQIKINRKHRAYKNLLSLTDADEYKEMSNDDKLQVIHDGLKLLLASWARFEDLINNDKRRKEVQNTRYDWGRELDIFLEKNIN